MFKYHQNTHINRPFNIVLNSGTNKVVFMPKTNQSSIWAQIGPFLCPNYGKWLYHLDLVNPWVNLRQARNIHDTTIRPQFLP